MELAKLDETLDWTRTKLVNAAPRTSDREESWFMPLSVHSLYWCKSKLFFPNEIFSLDCFRGRQVHWTETKVNSFDPFVRALFICVGAVRMGRDGDKTLGAWDGAASGKIRDGHMELLLLWLFRIFVGTERFTSALYVWLRDVCVWMWDRASQPIISWEIYEFIPSTLPSLDLFLLRSMGERRPPHNQRHRCPDGGLAVLLCSLFSLFNLPPFELSYASVINQKRNVGVHAAEN